MLLCSVRVRWAGVLGERGLCRLWMGTPTPNGTTLRAPPPLARRALRQAARGARAMADLTAVLQAAQSPDAGTRQQAEAQLQGMEASNYGAFLTLLVAELAAEAKPAQTRRLAGLIMKNAVYADDGVRRAEKAAKWLAVDEAAKAQIRAALLATLASQARVCVPRGGVGARRAPRAGAPAGSPESPLTALLAPRRCRRRATRARKWWARSARWTWRSGSGRTS